MRKNEYNCIEEFISQYTGSWNPSEGHWLGLDFSYNGKEYRFHTGSMYNENKTLLPNGKYAIFGLYERLAEDEMTSPFKIKYALLKEFSTMDEVLISTVIDNRPFAEIILDDDTELLGQD